MIDEQFCATRLDALGFVTNPLSCTFYYICVAGETTIMECSIAGTQFNADTLTCEFGHECDRESTDSITTMAPESPTTPETTGINDVDDEG